MLIHGWLLDLQSWEYQLAELPLQTAANRLNRDLLTFSSGKQVSEEYVENETYPTGAAEQPAY